MSRPELTLVARRSVVVAAASRHGVIRAVADRIARDLVDALPRTWSVTRVDLTDLRDLARADAVVLGSAVYDGHWMHGAARALEYLHEAPPADLWLFSNAPISQTRSADEQMPSADDLVVRGEADEHVVFGGDLDDTELSPGERFAVRTLRSLRADHRRWEAVDDWADRIACHLMGRAVPTNGTHGTTRQGVSL
jgi:menaquinone-dependent protoporphyrinogen oxidase